VHVFGEHATVRTSLRIKIAIAANRPYLIEVPVDREIRPIGTGSWELPPLPQPEPNFLKALAAAGLTL
jgi:acetolactate synthase-1/2/3 large subunit